MARTSHAAVAAPDGALSRRVDRCCMSDDDGTKREERERVNLRLKAIKQRSRVRRLLVRMQLGGG